MENKEKFKNIEDYIIYWDDFFKEWNKGESHQEELLKSDNIWGNHRGEVRTVKKTGKLKSTKLEFNVLPQPYLGDINSHSVITLNLNPSRSKKGEKIHVLKNLEKGNENDVFEEEHLPNFKKAKNYYQYAKDFPTYDINFWQNQKNWIHRIFQNLVKEEPSDKKNKEEIKPFAIEICPWGSKSFQKLEIDKEIIDYMDKYVFDVIEKVIKNSKLKMVLTVGKPYYDIFDHGVEFNIKNEISNLKNKPKELDWPQTKDKKSGKDRDVNRSFSIWKRKEIFYLNTYASGSNKSPGEDFIEIEKKLIKEYLK